VPEYSTSNTNTFQFELYFNGDIRVSYLSIAVDDCIAGLSEGDGLDPDYYPSDLSLMGACGPRPPTAQDGSVSTPANTPVTIALLADDDGLPDPPAALSYVIGSLPEHGSLSDPGAGAIESVPYTLVGGNEVVYTPDLWYMDADYFQFYANDGGESPEGGNSNIAVVAITVTSPAPQLVHGFALDSDPGWGCEAQWEFGAPTGGGTHNGDPVAAHTGSFIYGYNLAGDYTSGMASPVYLTTTAIDCTGLLDVELRFWRWLGVERQPFDYATVAVSSNGSDWTEVWANPTSTVSDSTWTQMAFDITAIAEDEPTVYVRWSMGPTDGGITYPGWSIDDVEIWAIPTFNPDCPGDLDNDGDIDISDLSTLLANYGTTSGALYMDGDVDTDGDVDISDLSVLLAGYGPCP
jgi:hypothetical protein